MATQAKEIIQVRTYSFQYGILHLEKATAASMTDAGVADTYCDKGALLEAWDGEMDANEFFDLPDFGDL